MKAGNMVFSGVGGQGILLASDVVAQALGAAGYDVKKSEVHGMAQRGGSVLAHLRYGPLVYSPVVEEGSADLLVAFEQLESARQARYLKTSSKVLVNTQRILPHGVSTGTENYPDALLERLRGMGVAVLPLDAHALAAEAGELKAVSVVMVGAISPFLPAGEELFLDAVARKAPPKAREANIAAFRLGRNAAMALG